MSASGSSDGSSLAGFGAELEAELLQDSGGYDGGGADTEAQFRERTGAADAAADDDAEPDAKRARVEPAPSGARPRRRAAL